MKLPSPARILYLAIITAICLYLVLPTAVVALSSLSPTAVLAFPPDGLSLRWYQSLFGRPEFVQSMLLSFGLGLAIATIATAISLLVAIETARRSDRIRQAVESLGLLPLVLPGIVYGPALLLLAGRLQLTTSFWPTFILLAGAHVVIALPFSLRVCMAAYRGLDPALEEAAAVAGAGRARIIRRVIMPAMGSALLASALFAFLFSFDEPVVSLFLSRQDLVTLPVQIQTYMRFRPDPTIAAISTVMSLLSLIAVVVVDRVFGLDRLFGIRR